MTSLFRRQPSPTLWDFTDRPRATMGHGTWCVDSPHRSGLLLILMELHTFYTLIMVIVPYLRIKRGQGWMSASSRKFLVESHLFASETSLLFLSSIHFFIQCSQIYKNKVDKGVWGFWGEPTHQKSPFSGGQLQQPKNYTWRLSRCWLLLFWWIRPLSFVSLWQDVSVLDEAWPGGGGATFQGKTWKTLQPQRFSLSLFFSHRRSSMRL